MRSERHRTDCLLRFVGHCRGEAVKTMTDAFTLSRYASATVGANLHTMAVYKPPLTMALECERDIYWKDWKGVNYSLKEEWKYVNGPAERKESCTPGTRDEGNDGRMPADFLSAINVHIREQRQVQHRKNFGRFLLREEEADAVVDTVAVEGGADEEA